MLTARAPIVKRHLLAEPIDNFVWQAEELLICRRLDDHLVASATKGLANAHSHSHSVATYTLVESIAKQRLELKSQKSTLSQQRTVLLDKRKEVVKQALICNHKSFAKECSDLRATNIEDIGQTRYILKREVRALGHKSIAEARAIDIQGDIVIVANCR